MLAAQTSHYLRPDLVANLHVRLNRIEGHVGGVRRMLADREDCERVLVQLVAIRAALNQVIIKVLAGHTDTCFSNCAWTGGGDTSVRHLKHALTLVLEARPHSETCLGYKSTSCIRQNRTRVQYPPRCGR